MTDYVRRVVAELIGAVKHGAVYVGRTPDGYDGATKDDVVEFAGQIADLLDGGYVLVKADGLNHGDELAIGSTPELFDGQPLWVRRSVPENGDTQ